MVALKIKLKLPSVNVVDSSPRSVSYTHLDVYKRQMLDIKPILTIEHGLVESLDKLRGKKKLLDKLIAKIQDDSDFDAENPKFLIVQSDEDKGQEACEKLRDEYGEDCIEMYGEFGPLIGTHVGRGAIAILAVSYTHLYKCRAGSKRYF